MRTQSLPHPGEIIEQMCLESLGVTVAEASQPLGASRIALSAILNRGTGISPDMAVRQSIAFGTSAESGVNRRTQYDLWRAEQRRKQLRASKLAV